MIYSARMRPIRRTILTAIALVIWFYTQRLIGARSVPAQGIGDGLHQLTAPWNGYFLSHAAAANALLIVSSAFIDLLALFLLLRWLFGPSVRPFLGLFVLMVMRQIVQAFCALPPPPNLIWHYPGFPSLLVTYSVAGDFFFSGHTAIAVFAATEIARLKKAWLTTFAILVALFEIVAVLVLRAHYTMDIFTGIIAALWVAAIIDRISKPIDSFVRSREQTTSEEASSTF
ncbi:MAG: phosphatase PAP2 family protein [Acidobacteria bacterium]|nr:phosphatase PAP2 family protein [Acidobacteriota bacterium]MBS1864831.1 phosphatase PAP2 family protein [Acidobacteriota bacterium]